MKPVRARLVTVAALIAGVLSCGEVGADPLQFLFTPFHFRDVVSANSVGRTPGDRLLVGADVRPNPRCCADFDTTVTASQGTVNLELVYLDSPALPDQFARSTAYDPALTGAWLVTAANPNSPNSPLQTLSHVVGSAPALPFVQDMALTGSETTPTFHWTVPAGVTPSRVDVFLYNLDDPISVGAARIIHTARLNPGVACAASQCSYTPPTVLNPDGDTIQPGTRYSVSIDLVLERLPGSTLTRSRSFFDFTPVDAGPIPVHLPTVDPTSGAYHFNTSVQAGQVIFIDPLVAIGYDYAIGTGDPHFESVLLPHVGDGVFDLYLWNGTGFVFSQHLLAGEPFSFGEGGVDRFRILGIERDAGLDPRNPTAFVTGLTFADTGRFTGTMTPITARFATTVGECKTLIATLRNHTSEVSLTGRQAEKTRAKLSSKLDDAVGKLDEGKTSGAVGKLGGYRDRVVDLIADGGVSQADGEILLHGVEDGIDCVQHLT